jgi:C4-dicarboxylate transporter DctQ subunit
MFFLSRFNRYAEEIVGAGLAFLLLGITIILCFNVIARYGFGYALFWAEELTNFTIIWITLLGSTLCIRHGMHMGVDILLQHVHSNFGRRIIICIQLIISLIFVAIIALVGSQQVVKIYQFGQISPALMIPMYIPYIALPIGGVLMVLSYLELLLKNILNFETDKVINDA